MPCQSDYMRDSNDPRYDSLVIEHNKLTAEADILRETLLAVIENPQTAKIPAKLVKSVQAQQVKHRKLDLRRLEQTFTKSKDAERLAKVWSADPNLPLEPQLGFDPDVF